MVAMSAAPIKDSRRIVAVEAEEQVGVVTLFAINRLSIVTHAASYRRWEDRYGRQQWPTTITT